VWLEHLLSGEATIFYDVIYNMIIEFIFITRFKGKQLERWLFEEIERREKREERREKREERKKIELQKRACSSGG
jgi:hypothetical protein